MLALLSSGLETGLAPPGHRTTSKKWCPFVLVQDCNHGLHISSAREGGQKAAMRVILDAAGGRLNFEAPEAIVRADTASDVPGALEALERARRAGKWLAGVLAYELGYALEPRLQPLTPPDGPLLVFGVYGRPIQIPPAISIRPISASARVLHFSAIRLLFTNSCAPPALRRIAPFSMTGGCRFSASHLNFFLKSNRA
jgi:hypothetical protein